MLSSSKLAGIMNVRHKHLAHSLSQTRKEREAPVELMRYGHEREVLEVSFPIVEVLHRRVNGSSFSFERSRMICRKHAEALWKNCRFEISE